MSEDTPDDATDEEVADALDDLEAAEEEAAEQADGQLDESEDAAADVSGLDLSGADLDPNPDGDGDGGDSSESDGDDGTDVEAGEWGDMYVSCLTSTTNAVLKKHGDGHEVGEEHFRSIDLDQHFNSVMEKYAKDSEMPPEQALVVGSMVAVGGPIAMHTDLLTDAAEQVREQANRGGAT